MIYLTMSLTTEDLLKIDKLIELRINPVIHDVSEIKDRLIDVQDGIVRLSKKQDEDYAFLSLQIIDINRHLGLNK